MIKWRVKRRSHGQSKVMFKLLPKIFH
uniref:Uncharacterized protein LOC105123623 isoform X2 n=1 Tax=Rhizophora mucronata TaxID=61149 RepID=A0A2P2LD52_RHIMU